MINNPPTLRRLSRPAATITITISAIPAIERIGMALSSQPNFHARGSEKVIRLQLV